MAIIDQLTTSNTFQEWLSATTELIDMNNQFVGCWWCIYSK